MGGPREALATVLPPTPGRGNGIRVEKGRRESPRGARGVPAGAATCPPGDSSSPSRTCWRGGAGARRGGSVPLPGGCGLRCRAGGCRPAVGDASGCGALAAGGGPGSRLARCVAGALLLALAEAAAAALPLQLQKAPESDSNFCQTRERTWSPSHVACAPEPSSRPPLPCLCP